MKQTTIANKQRHDNLQRYLESLLVNTDEVDCPLTGTTVVCNMVDMLVHLKRGYMILQTANRQCIGDSLAYDAWLEKAFVLFMTDRRTRSSDQIWKENMPRFSGKRSRNQRQLCTQIARDIQRLLRLSKNWHSFLVFSVNNNNNKQPAPL